jgi:hypothetical protein
MASTLRETLSASAPKYHKHPAAGNAASYVRDGMPVDAGTWSRVINNLSVLRWEGVRHVLTDIGPGDITINEAGDWDGLSEDVPDEDQRSGVAYQEISWRLVGNGATGTSTNCRVYGPLPVVFDRAAIDTGPEHYARAYRVEVHAYGTTDFRMYAALTAGFRPPSEGTLAFDYDDCTGTSAAAPETLRFDLIPVLQSGDREPETRHSSGSSDDGSSVVHVVEAYLWIGWHLSAAGTSGWLAASAWELLEI